MDSENNNLPNRHTTPENYEAYCQFIEALAKKMKWKNPPPPTPKSENRIPIVYLKHIAESVGRTSKNHGF